MHDPKPAANSSLQIDQGDSFLDARINLRNELNIQVRNKDEVMIEDPIREKFFSIGFREYQFVMLLNGKRTIQNVLDQLNSRGDTALYDEAAARSIYHLLASNNLLQNNTPANTKRLAETAARFQRRKFIGWLNPISLKVGLGNPTAALQRITPLGKILFSKTAFFLWITLAIWAAQQLFEHWERFSQSSVGILANGRWIWLLVCWLVLKIIHETAHGLACIKYGGRVREAGVLLLLFTPMAYVDVTSSWRFPLRRQRLIVSAAGMYAELFVAFLAVIVWSRTAPGLLADMCYNVIIMASVTTILFNANPLMRFDGYYILSDLVGITNLYAKSQSWLGSRLRSLYFGIPPAKCGSNGWKKPVIVFYAFAATFWKITLTASLLIGASCLFHGAGLVLAIIGAVFWVGLPLANQIKQTRALLATQSVHRQRFAIAGCVTALLMAVVIFVLAAPRTAGSPAIVQLKDEQIVRATANGFLKEILVEDGMHVERDQPLAILENPELQYEAVSLLTSMAQCQIQARIYRQQGQLALFQSEQHNIAGLQEHLGEVNEQLQQLIIRAPVSGVLSKRQLPNLLGSFLHRGDVIVTIGSPESKEILVSIDQNQVHSIQEIQSRPIRVLFPGTTMIAGTVQHIDPRVSDIPISDAWCAPNGGPLAVRVIRDADSDHASSGSKLHLLEPRFTARVELPAEQSQMIRSGQHGKAYLHTKRQSLGAYFYVSVRRWLQHKIETSMRAA